MTFVPTVGSSLHGLRVGIPEVDSNTYIQRQSGNSLVQGVLYR